MSEQIAHREWSRRRFGWVTRCSPATVTLWAAGVAASPLGRVLGAPVDRVGRVFVQPDLSIPGHPEVFVIGDLAAFRTEDGKMLPGVAPVAIQEGKAVAKNIERDLTGRQREAFHYVDKGSLATIGRAAAVAVRETSYLRPFCLAGLAGRAHFLPHRVPQPVCGDVSMDVVVLYVQAGGAADHGEAGDGRSRRKPAPPRGQVMGRSYL